jgi:hypothetical protein
LERRPGEKGRRLNVIRVVVDIWLPWVARGLSSVLIAFYYLKLPDGSSGHNLFFVIYT